MQQRKRFKTSHDVSDEKISYNMSDAVVDDMVKTMMDYVQEEEEEEEQEKKSVNRTHQSIVTLLRERETGMRNSKNALRRWLPNTIKHNLVNKTLTSSPIREPNGAKVAEVARCNNLVAVLYSNNRLAL